MSNSIKPEELQEVLKDYLENYVEDITEGVEDTTDTLTKEAVKELKETSPRGKGTREKPYHKGWTKQKGKENRGRYTVKIHNKTNYQLTHLLEMEEGQNRFHTLDHLKKNTTNYMNKELLQ